MRRVTDGRGSSSYDCLMGLTDIARHLRGPKSEPPRVERALWNGAVIAVSADTVVVEGNNYFPPESLNWEYFRPSSTHTLCGWKGEASYLDVVVDGKVNSDAAWYYPDPKPAAARITGRVAFWHGVRVQYEV